MRKGIGLGVSRAWRSLVEQRVFVLRHFVPRIVLWDIHGTRQGSVRLWCGKVTFPPHGTSILVREQNILVSEKTQLRGER